MKALLIDINNNLLRVVHPKGLKDYYKLLDCTHVDIVRRRIGMKDYQIICDDEGLLKNSYIVSAISSRGDVMFVGNLLICGLVDEEGELTDLTRDDVQDILAHIVSTPIYDDPEDERWLLTECNF